MSGADGGELGQRIAAVAQAALNPIVRALWGSDNVEVIDWGHRSVEGGFGHAYGVYRFQGRAAVDGATRDWSAILKVLGPANGSPEQTAWNYWKREALVYQSGLLNDWAADLTAPRCLDVVEQPGSETWLWLEDVEERAGDTWPLERYGVAARHLGQFNGAYLAGQPLPDVSWLSNGQFRERLAEAEPGVAQLPALARNPLFAGMSTDESMTHSLRLWAQRARWLAVRDRLPRTLCHHDAFRRNLMARDGADGHSQTVAIDWAKLGPGVVGEELVALFSTTLRFVAVDLDRIAELDALIFAGYVDGLRDAGWHGETWLARFGFAATAALTGIASQAIKWPSVVKWAAALPPDAERPRLLSPGGVAQSSAVDAHLLRLGDEACELVDSVAGRTRL